MALTSQHLKIEIVKFDREKHEGLLPEITNMLHDAYRPLLEKGMRYVASHQSNEITLKRLTEGYGFLAFLSDELVGTISLVSESSHSPCNWYQRPEVFFFTQFAVKPGLQGKGIGSQLMDYVESFATKKGATEIALDTSEKAEDLIFLYKKRGYRFVELIKWPKTKKWPETNYKSVVMSKTL